MAENVYIMPPGILTGAGYGDQFRIASERGADGALLGATEIAPRAPFTMSGRVIRSNFPAWRIFRDRLRGGLGLAGLIDFEMRKWLGADLVPAVNSSGAEFWRADGLTSLYAGEGAGGTYRSINASAVGAHTEGDTTIAVDGLFSTEALLAGTTVRIGDWRYVLAEDVTASGGAATLTLSQGIRADIADNAAIRVPGDFMLARMAPGSLRLGEVNAAGLSDFSAEFREDYSDEIVGGVGSYVLP